LQFYNPTFCLDIKDFDVCDLDPFDDHVSSATIVCHQSPCDPKDDVSTSIYGSIPCSDSQLSDYLVAFEVCQRSHFLEIDDKELENVNMGGCRPNKHVEIWAKNAFDEWWQFRGYETNMSIANMLEKEDNV
jgi:hypothetical protein